MNFVEWSIPDRNYAQDFDGHVVSYYLYATEPHAQELELSPQCMRPYACRKGTRSGLSDGVKMVLPQRFIASCQTSDEVAKVGGKNRGSALLQQLKEARRLGPAVTITPPPFRLPLYRNGMDITRNHNQWPTIELVYAFPSYSFSPTLSDSPNVLLGKWHWHRFLAHLPL